MGGSAMDYTILCLRDRPEMLEAAAAWFHAKWGIPAEAYRDSMRQCLAGDGPVPQWYMAQGDGEPTPSRVYVRGTAEEGAP